MKKMQQKNLKAFFTNKILIAACVISPLVFFGVAAVLADVWSGPANRTSAGSCTIVLDYSKTVDLYGVYPMVINTRKTITRKYADLR